MIAVSDFCQKHGASDFHGFDMMYPARIQTLTYTTIFDYIILFEVEIARARVEGVRSSLSIVEIEGAVDNLSGEDVSLEATAVLSLRLPTEYINQALWLDAANTCYTPFKFKVHYTWSFPGVLMAIFFVNSQSVKSISYPTTENECTQFLIK